MFINGHNISYSLKTTKWNSAIHEQTIIVYHLVTNSGSENIPKKKIFRDEVGVRTINNKTNTRTKLRKHSVIVIISKT